MKRKFDIGDKVIVNKKIYGTIDKHMWQKEPTQKWFYRVCKDMGNGNWLYEWFGQGSLVLAIEDGDIIQLWSGPAEVNVKQLRYIVGDDSQVIWYLKINPEKFFMRRKDISLLEYQWSLDEEYNRVWFNV